MSTIESIPDVERLIEILRDPQGPSRLTLDLDGSDTPLTGIVHVGLDADGNLIEVL